MAHEPPSTGAEGLLREIRTSFPARDLVHQIEIRGGCDWQTVLSIGNALSQAQGRLDSLAARRYLKGGEVTTVRVRNLNDERLREAVEIIRTLPGVSDVSVTHIIAL